MTIFKPLGNMFTTMADLEKCKPALEAVRDTLEMLEEEINDPQRLRPGGGVELSLTLRYRLQSATAFMRVFMEQMKPDCDCKFNESLAGEHGYDCPNNPGRDSGKVKGE